MNKSFLNIVDGVETIRLYRSIGLDGIDGAAIAEHINYINECYSDSVKEIKVRINSNGGSVQDGLSICSAILNSKIPVTTCIDGMAYSIAGVIAMCGSKRVMSDYGTFMMHNASGGDNNEVLELITNSLAKIFEKTTALTLDVCRDLMSKETWMSAEECYSMGLIDEIIETKINKPAVETMNTVELHAFYNEVIVGKSKLKTKPKMNKLFNKLNLENNATEEQVIEKVTSIEVEADTYKAEMNALQAEFDVLKAKLKEYEDAEIAKEEAQKESVVTKAIEEGKITNESKDKWLSAPIKSNDLVNLFESMKATPAFVNVLDEAKKNEVKVKGDRSEWTYSDWEKKDPNGLLEIKNNNPVEFDRLITTINTTLKSKK